MAFLNKMVYRGGMLYFAWVLALVANEKSVKQQLMGSLKNEALDPSFFDCDVLDSVFELSHLHL